MQIFLEIQDFKSAQLQPSLQDIDELIFRPEGG